MPVKERGTSGREKDPAKTKPAKRNKRLNLTSLKSVEDEDWENDEGQEHQRLQRPQDQGSNMMPVEVQHSTDVEKGPPTYSSAFAVRASAQATGVGEELVLNHRYFASIPGILKLIQVVSSSHPRS